MSGFCKRLYMFTNFIFLTLVLLLVSFSVELQPVLALAPLAAFGWGMLSYGLLLGLIILQNRLKISLNRRLALTNCECLLFFTLYHYILGAERIYTFGSFKSPILLFSLMLYFLALALAYKKQRSDQIRLLIPFALPFLLFTFLVDLFLLLPPDNKLVRMFMEASPLVSFIPSLLFVGVLLILLPPFIVRLWKCMPLEQSELKSRLDNLCEKAHFQHAGFKTWGTMSESLTAAILGVLPKWRYILFTNRLLKELSPQAVEAVLAHEIGHSQRRHLLFYPLIILGMAVAMLLLSICCERPLEAWWQLSPFSLFVAGGILFWLYFRYIYGYFSRLFERQADLHVFALGVPPEAMVEALDHVGTKSGFIHLVPNWHHFSIQERIDFLKSAMQDPTLIERHHRKVRWARYAYLFFLFLGLTIILGV